MGLEVVKEFGWLLQSNCSKDIEWFVKVSAFTGFAASITLAIGLQATNLPDLYITAICVAVFAAPFPLHFMLQHYIFELRKRKKEGLVPDLLLQASAFPKGTAFEKVLEYFSHERFGLLGKEFAMAGGEIAKGASVRQALDNVTARCRSNVVERAMLLLKQGYDSGVDMGRIFRESADDLLETNAILRERNAALVIEKYTLLLAGGVIVPAVLGLLGTTVAGMDFSALELLEFGAPAAEKGLLLSSTMLANQIYIIEYALLASFFVALLEGNPKKALVYAAMLLPLSIVSFNAAGAFFL